MLSLLVIGLFLVFGFGLLRHLLHFFLGAVAFIFLVFFMHLDPLWCALLLGLIAVFAHTSRSRVNQH